MQGPEPPPSPSLFARVGRILERYRLPIQLAVDLMAWAFGLYFAMVLRFESFTPTGWNRFDLGGLLAAMAAAAAVQTVSGLALGLYLGRWRFGTLDEVSHLVASVAITVGGLALINQLSDPLLVPSSVPLAGGRSTTKASAAPEEDVPESPMEAGVSAKLLMD